MKKQVKVECLEPWVNGQTMELGAMLNGLHKVGNLMQVAEENLKKHDEFGAKFLQKVTAQMPMKYNES